MKRDRVAPTSVGTAKNNVIFCQPAGGDMVRVVKHRGEILKEEVYRYVCTVYIARPGQTCAPEHAWIEGNTVYIYIYSE